MAGRKRPVIHVDKLNYLGASERVPQRHPINRVQYKRVPTKETDQARIAETWLHLEILRSCAAA